MKIITFPNDKGGTGKTTSAVNVADYLARQIVRHVHRASRLAGQIGRAHV